MSEVRDASPSFPGLLSATEERSAGRQKVFYWSIGGQAVALAIAAAIALLPVDALGRIGPFVAVLVFVGIIVLQVSGVADKAEREWYEARAASESIKAACWEYSTGGESFRLTDKASAERFRTILKDILGQLKHLDVPSASRINASVTDSMAALRNSSVEVRQAAYGLHRIDDQLGWYSKKSTSNKSRAFYARIILVALSAVAIIVGLLRSANYIDVNIMSVLVAMTSGVIAWTQTKKYTQLAESYSVTSQDIALLSSTLGDQKTEEEWAQFVHDAEAAFSREHTMWRARMQGPV